MKTRTPSLETPPEIKKREDGRITQVRRYKLITPLFGGGVEPNQADPITIVRGTEVRGQLRFWWRATRGGQFDGDLDRMRQAEEAIWGSAAGKGGPSGLIIVVSEVKSTPEFQKISTRKGKVDVGHPSSPYSYVAFPLRSESGKPAGKLRQEGIEFTVTITFPMQLEKPFSNLDVGEELTAALWAWETFGGLGARTRRGFGALQLLSVDDDDISVSPSDQFKTMLRKELRQRIVSGKWPDNVPHLSHNMRIEIYASSCQTSPIQVWDYLIKKLQHFRQQRYKRMGLSLWPEANEIRHRLKRSLKWPEQIKSPTLVHKFPRAAFGLPIQFHLPHDKGLRSNSFTLRGKPDPKTGRTFDRLASPLILKPVACADGQAVGLVAVLVTPSAPPHGLEIEELPESKQEVEWQVATDEANSTPIRKVLHGQTNVIEAFLSLFTNEQEELR